jgi:hypothetical protein
MSLLRFSIDFNSDEVVFQDSLHLPRPLEAFRIVAMLRPEKMQHRTRHQGTEGRFRRFAVMADADEVFVMRNIAASSRAGRTD